MDPKLVDVHGGKLITVNFEPVADAAAEGGFRTPSPESVKVRQIPVREYDAGFALLQDEPALVGFLCARPKQWVLTLTPDSYEEALVTGREVNARRFFTFCQRRTEQIEKQDAAMIGAMVSLPEDKLRMALELGRKSMSPTTSPGFVPPPVR